MEFWRPAEKPAKLPPVRVVRAVDAVRRGMRRIERRMVPAPAAVLELMGGAWVSRAIYIATKLGIADVLHDGPRSAEEIAGEVGANPDAVRRMLRMLASRGVFTVHGDDRFGLTPMANALRADAPASVCGIVLFFGHPYHWEHWGHLPYSVQTGRPSVDALRGKPVFEWLDDEPEFAAVFNEGMASASNT